MVKPYLKPVARNTLGKLGTPVCNAHGSFRRHENHHCARSRLRSEHRCRRAHQLHRRLDHRLARRRLDRQPLWGRATSSARHLRNGYSRSAHCAGPAPSPFGVLLVFSNSRVSSSFRSRSVPAPPMALPVTRQWRWATMLLANAVSPMIDGFDSMSPEAVA